VSTTDAEARQQLLDALGDAADAIGLAIAYLGEAYEHLDDHTAERLEEELFRPLQAAYGRARRTHSEFAARHRLPTRQFEPQSVRVASHGAKGHVEAAVAAVREAEAALVALQDSMMPVEYGDPELRAGLAEVRALLSDVPARARDLVRVLGR
jgi:hypothetical protein